MRHHVWLSAALLCSLNAKELTILDTGSKKISGEIEVNCNKKTFFGKDGVVSVGDDCNNAIVRACGYKVGQFELSAINSVTLATLHPKAIYFSKYGITHKQIRESAFENAKKLGVNAVVIDVKNDDGELLWKFENETAKRIGANDKPTVKDINKFIQGLKDQGFYTIARIAIFKDGAYAKANPEDAIKTPGGAMYIDKQKVPWSSPYSKNAREYNIQIMEETARAGFDEIQVDYVRFPDKKGLNLLGENSTEARIKKIREFALEAKERLRVYPVAYSADLFGYVAWHVGDIGIGQRAEETIPVFDYNSLMLYPSGFEFGIPKYKDPVKNPYEIVYLSLKSAQERTGLPSCRFRPWLQVFKDYAFDRRHFTKTEISAQIKASNQFGTNGWMLWNPRNVYTALGDFNDEIVAKNDKPLDNQNGL